MNLIRVKHQATWEEILFDIDFLNHFGYAHWENLSVQKEEIGFLLDPTNKIEIKQGAKTVARLFSNKLLNSETLFPLYNTQETTLTLKNRDEYQVFYLIQLETGLIGKFQFETSQFSIEDLTFNLGKLDQFSFLKNIHFQNTPLTSISEDSLIVSSKVIMQL
jgi:hypothetical protein